MLLSEYTPRTALVTQSTVVTKPRFPVIDAHNHLGEPFGGGWDKRPIHELLDLLDEANVQAFVDLDGGWGEEILHNHLDYFKAVVPERFHIFGGVDWSKWAEHGNYFGEWAASRLVDQTRRGASGLKIWKPFGLTVRDHRGNLVSVDDPRLEPLWATAGELGVPVLLHVADPVTFFWPVDAYNERWEQLQAHPDWQFPSPPFPTLETILTGLTNLVSRFPATNFIGAHVGCYAENLAWVSALLDRCPNFFVDISARINELGRQPYTSRRFFIEYADRILFGTDVGPNLDMYRLYFRFLETNDEYFNADLGEVPLQGRWFIYGLYLPDEVLEKVYYRNALHILTGPQK